MAAVTDQRKWMRFGIAGAVALLLVIWVVTSRNSLVSKQEKVDLQWAEVENTYQRRLDLIPNLVNVVKGMSDFESGTLEKISAARANALRGLNTGNATPEHIARVQQLQDSLAIAANRIIATIEAYPELKGTSAYAGLQTQLEGTERRIKVARNDFNAAVQAYNQQLRSFPANLVAGMFGFKRRQGFQAEAGADRAVDIQFKPTNP